MKKIVFMAIALSLFSVESFACMKGSLESVLKESVGLGTTIAAGGGALSVSGSSSFITVISSRGDQLKGRICATSNRVVANLKGTDPQGKKISGSVVITRSGGGAHLSGSVAGQKLDSPVQ